MSVSRPEIPRRDRPLWFGQRTTRRRTVPALAVALSALLASGAFGIASAAPLPTGLDQPIRAFAWPADGQPDDPYFAIQSDLTPIGVASAWVRTTGASSVTVAVLDTGIDASNAEFAGRVVPGYNALTGVADTSSNFAPTNDGAGHGTHVAGTIAAAANNATGIAGIAPNVQLMPVKVLSDDGEGDFGMMVAGLDWAIDHGARIITMSLGGELEPSAVAYLQQLVDQAYAQGAVMIAASGNDGAAVTEYPCNFTHVICVGSTTNNGTAVSSFSTRTPALALVAPGEAIASTLPNAGYGYGSGTSMAVPHVTGAVALLRSVNPAVSPDGVFAALTQSAKPLTAGGRNPESGFGLLQVGAALDLLASGPVPTPTPSVSPTPTPTGSPTPTPTPTPTPVPGASPTPQPTLTPVPAPVLIVPAVTASSPVNGQRSVLRSVRPKITFSVPMSRVTTSTVRLKDLSRGRWVTIRVSYSATTRVATIVPTTRLAANHSYRITVGGVLSATAGTPLARPFVVTFRTGYR